MERAGTFDDPPYYPPLNEVTTLTMAYKPDGRAEIIEQTNIKLGELGSITLPAGTILASKSAEHGFYAFRIEGTEIDIRIIYYICSSLRVKMLN